VTGFWRRSVSLGVVSLFALLPLGEAVCGVLCDPSAATASGHGEHHTAAVHCDEPVPEQPQVGGASGHDCNLHDGAVRAVTSAFTAGRADVRLVHATKYVAPALPPLMSLDSTRAHSGSSPPPDPIAPTRAPLVLRI
jgi:hypothetical protein